MFRAVGVAGVLIAALASCASFQTASQSDPGRKAPHYNRILVSAIGSDLRLRQRNESTFVRAGAKLGVEVIPYHAVFFLGRQYSDSELVATMRARQIPAFLMLADGTTDAPTVVTVAGSSTGCNSFQCRSSGAAETSTRQDHFTIYSRVYDLNPKSDPLWMGSTRIERKWDEVSDERLLAGLAKDVITTLVRDGIVDVRVQTRNGR